MSERLFLKFIWVLIKVFGFASSQLKVEFESELDALKGEQK